MRSFKERSTTAAGSEAAAPQLRPFRLLPSTRKSVFDHQMLPHCRLEVIRQILQTHRQNALISFTKYQF